MICPTYVVSLLGSTVGRNIFVLIYLAVTTEIQPEVASKAVLWSIAIAFIRLDSWTHVTLSKNANSSQRKLVSSAAFKTFDLEMMNQGWWTATENNYIYGTIDQMSQAYVSTLADFQILDILRNLKTYKYYQYLFQLRLAR